MADIATLGISVDSRDLITGKKRVEDLERSGGKLEKRTRSMTKQFGLMAGAMAAVFAFRKIIRETERQQLAMAQLGAVLESTGGVAGKTAESYPRRAQFAFDNMERVLAGEPPLNVVLPD